MMRSDVEEFRVCAAAWGSFANVPTLLFAFVPADGRRGGSFGIRLSQALAIRRRPKMRKRRDNPVV